jgi:hypothetical protein
MMSRKILSLLFAFALFILSGFANTASAEIRVGISLPSFVLPAPPSVVVIPGTYVYIVPDIDTDILFYQGYWWRPYEGRWYRGRSYNGPWNYMRRGVPRALYDLPPNYHEYRHVRPGFERIPHGDIKRNWRGWEKQRHWDNHEGWREGRNMHGEKRGEQRGQREGRRDR